MITLATTKIWKVSNSLSKAIDYIADAEKTKREIQRPSENYSLIARAIYYAKNPDKTLDEQYVTGINCTKESALEEMQDTKNMYGKTDKIKAFHAVQSFREGEVTPEQAHEIGVQLANEMWKDRFEVLVTTHVNTKHIHNHFVINSVSFVDGKKYYLNLGEIALLRHTSDEICMEHELSVLKERPTEKGINFERFLEREKSTNKYYLDVKSDIDRAIGQAIIYMDFYKVLTEMGYYFEERAGKLSVRPPNRKRNIRLERIFGEKYSIDSIKSRIQTEKEMRVSNIKMLSKFYEPEKDKTYFKKNLDPYKEARMSKYEAVKYLRQFSKNTHFLCERKIDTSEQLLAYKEEQIKKIDEISKSLRNIRYLLKNKKLSNEDKEFLLAKKEQLNTEKKYHFSEINGCNKVIEMSKGVQEQEKEREKVNEISKEITLT